MSSAENYSHSAKHLILTDTLFFRQSLSLPLPRPAAIIPPEWAIGPSCG